MASEASPPSSADPLLDLLLPHLPPTTPPPDPTISSSYLARLSSLPLTSILETEPFSLAASLHSLNLNLQKLSSRSHKALIASSHHLSAVPASTTQLDESLSSLREDLPTVDAQITAFTTSFSRDGPHLQQRQKSHLLSRNLDRLLDILQLPTLLQSLISSSSYPTALDLLAHVRRLQTLYPTSPTILSVAAECDTLQKSMTSNLIATLRGPLKLPTAMKTIGFLRRCSTASQLDERGLRGLFLVCRCAFLAGLLEALEPLRHLADDEKRRRVNGNGGGNNVSGGGSSGSYGGSTQTERYLKRWIEVFREQSFGIVSMYRSIFPNALPSPSYPESYPSSPIIGSSPVLSQGPLPNFSQTLPQSRVGTIRSRSSSTLSTLSSGLAEDDPDGGQPPDPLCSFVLHLVNLLTETLGAYLGNVEERGVRESLLTQVLYAAGSLGRLGGEFGAILGVVECFGMGMGEEEEDEEMEDGDRGDGEEEWVSVVAKHKVLASRLETLAGRG